MRSQSGSAAPARIRGLAGDELLALPAVIDSGISDRALMIGGPLGTHLPSRVSARQVLRSGNTCRMVAADLLGHHSESKRRSSAFVELRHGELRQELGTGSPSRQFGDFKPVGPERGVHDAAPRLGLSPRNLDRARAGRKPDH